MSIQCRTCAVMIFNPTARNIFEEDDDEILQNIEVLTGVLIKEDQHMPKHICTCCHLDLYYSIAFRERCLRTENILQKAVQNGSPLNDINKRIYRGTTDAQLVKEVTRKPDAQSRAAQAKTEQHVTDIASAPSVHTLNEKGVNVSNVETDSKATKQSNSSPQSNRDDYEDSMSSLSGEFGGEDVDSEEYEHCLPSPTGNSSQRRSSRISTQKVNTPSSITPHASNWAKSPTLANIDADCKPTTADLKSSSRTSVDDNVDNASRLLDKLNDAEEDEDLAYSESEFENSLPSLDDEIKDDDASSQQVQAITKLSSKTRKKKSKMQPEKSTKFVCDICGHKSGNQKNLNLHKMRHTGVKNYKCSECDMEYYTKYLLDVHIRVKHKGEKPFSCRYCDMRFTARTTKHLHEATKHIKDYKYDCKTCGKKFLTSTCLLRHGYQHTRPRPFKCDLCDVAFSEQAVYNRHCLTKKHRVKVLESQGVEGVALVKANLENLLKTKTKPMAKPEENLKVFVCDLCGHQSQSPKNLELHILRHKGEKNFECEECGLKHYSKYLLKLHIRVKHQGEKPFSCKFCGLRFYSGTTRLLHERVHHIKEFRYECKLCGKKFIAKSCLNKHEFQHTGLKPYRCDLCNVAFPRRPGLRVHCRTKQHQKRASEAQNNQLNVANEITLPDPESIENVNALM